MSISRGKTQEARGATMREIISALAERYVVRGTFDRPPPGMNRKTFGSSQEARRFLEETLRGRAVDARLLEQASAALSTGTLQVFEPSSIRSRLGVWVPISRQDKAPPPPIPPPPGTNDRADKQLLLAQWSSPVVTRDQVVFLLAGCVGFPDGTPARLLVHEVGAGGKQELLTTLEATVRRDGIRREWKFSYPKDTREIPTLRDDGHYAPPRFRFEARVEGQKAQSGEMEFRDQIELHFEDEQGNPLPTFDYTLHFGDGTTRTGTLSDGGLLLERDVPPGRFVLEWGAAAE